MKKLIIATNNPGKVKEFKAMIKNYEVLSLKDLGIKVDVEETGTTFYENALIKAKAVSELVGEDALADDSGLSVDALGGAPGIYSARYADGTDEGNLKKVLEDMKDEKVRDAKFCCALVLYKKGGEIISSYGETAGRLLYEPQGENGFGYDPIFYSTEIDKCFGIASPEEKNSVSHRSRAIRELIEKLD